jgi:hypothetical protein
LSAVIEQAASKAVITTVAGSACTSSESRMFNYKYNNYSLCGICVLFIWFSHVQCEMYCTKRPQIKHNMTPDVNMTMNIVQKVML